MRLGDKQRLSPGLLSESDPELLEELECFLFFFLFLFLGLSLREYEEDEEEEEELLSCLLFLCELLLGLLLREDELDVLEEDDELYFLFFFLSLLSGERDKLELDEASRDALLRRLMGLLPRDESITTSK